MRIGCYLCIIMDSNNIMDMLDLILDEALHTNEGYLNGRSKNIVGEI